MRRALWSAVLVAVFGTIVPLSGQSANPELEAQRRNECRLAAQVLRTAHPDPHREWALSFISRCEAEGLVVLAASWGTIPVVDDVEKLAGASVDLRDARLYQQLRRTATDGSRPAKVRVAALLVLARYTDPQNAIWLGDLVPPDTIDWIPLKLGWAAEARQTMGDVPLTEPIAAPVLALFEQIAAARETEPVQVWYAAAVLAQRLRRDIQAGFAH
jgi:hypothetical protein